MWLTNQAGRRVWVEFGWLPAIDPKATSPAMRAWVAAQEMALLELFKEHAWEPSEGGGGLVFPLKPESIKRAHSEPDKVKVGFATCNGHLAGAVVIHLDDAIKPYAHRSVALVKRSLNVQSVAFVRSLCVSRHLRGFGIGRALLTVAREISQELGAGAIVGHLRVNPQPEERLRRAYEQGGFSPLGEEITVTIQKEDNGWKELFGREIPVCPEQLREASIVKIGYVPVAARCSVIGGQRLTGASGSETHAVSASA